MQHRFPMQKEGDPAPKKKGQKQQEDDVESYLYRCEENGTICQPATHLIGALKRAGVKFQIPGQGKTTYKNLMGSGAVFIEPDMIEHENQEWEIDRRPVVIQRARVTRSRPMFKKWALSFTAEIDEDELPKSVLNEILEYAGRRVGIGDFRPDKGGPFGRFIVTTFEEI